MTRIRIGGDVQAIEGWYLHKVRPFLERIEKAQVKASRIEDFDAELERLRKAREAYDDDLVVCFLGQAGIGKSTLINALVDGRRSTLPHGGVGPLTAQALSVRRGSPPGFKVTYHASGQIWKLIMALEWGCKGELSEREASAPDDPQFEGPEEAPLTPEERQELRELVEGDGEGNGTRMQSYRKQAQLLVRGNQNSEAAVAYLIDALRAVLGKPAKRGAELTGDDLVRIGRISEALSRGQYECGGSVVDGHFREELEDHATGFLAPLIKEMSVTCESEDLPGSVVLVDLPGLGVAGDIHKDVTSKWIREQARSVVLVVGRSGLQEVDVRLLQESGFLNRLIYSAYDPGEDPVSLMVAVVRVDEIASTRHRTAKQSGDTSKKKQDFFDEVCDEAHKLILAQLKPLLQRAWSSGQIQDVQVQVIDNLLANLEVHPLSAIEYSKYLVDDEEERSFLSELERSNVPRLSESLRQLAQARRAAEVRRVEEIRHGFQSRLDAALNVIQAQWEEDTRATEEAERLREDFLGFIEPRRGEYRTRQGAYREFLRETLPQTIRAEVKEARSAAGKEINLYLAGLHDLHYQALKATVRKGGTHVTNLGRTIDLPRDFALRFEVPVADAWAKSILKQIRRRTKEFADDCVRLVDQVVEWAQAQGARLQPRLVEAQRDAIKADMNVLESVGRTMVGQLRKEVNARLVKRIEGPIRQRCKKFIDSNEYVGKGVKVRMLELFAELADNIIETASGPAEEVLIDAFRKVEKEILDVFERHPDPLDTARDSIVDAHEKYVKRSDAQKRGQVLAEIKSVLAERPAESPEDEQTEAA